jgi:hypothetical protein
LDLGRVDRGWHIVLWWTLQVRTHGGHGELLSAAWNRWAPEYQVQGEELSCCDGNVQLFS